MSKLNVLEREVTITTVKDEDYISLTDIARHRNADDPRFIIQNWMRTRSTIEFLGIWEILNNPTFNRVEFEAVKNEAGNNAFVMTPTKWVDLTRALGDEFGKGLSVANLKNFRQFYLVFPYAGKSYTLCSELSWSHWRLIMRVENPQNSKPRSNAATSSTGRQRKIAMHRTAKNCKSFGNCLQSNVAELNAQFSESAKLEQAIKANLKGLGYGE